MITGRAIRAEVEHYRRFMASSAKRIFGKKAAGRGKMNDTACFPDNGWHEFMASMHKNKTLTTWTALLAGAAGVHRIYLRGPGDRLALAHFAGVMGTLAMLVAAPQANVFWKLLPLIVSAIAGCIEALVIGLMPDEKFDARYNAGTGRASDSGWLLALGLVVTLMAGATLVIATMARLFDLLYTGGAYG